MKTHQIIHFTNGQKRTLFNVVGVKDNEFTHLILEDGRKILINKNNVLMIEVFKDKASVAKDTWGEAFGIYSANVDKVKKDLTCDCMTGDDSARGRFATSVDVIELNQDLKPGEWAKVWEKITSLIESIDDSIEDLDKEEISSIV